MVPSDPDDGKIRRRSPRTRGEGGLRKRADGRWEATLEVGGGTGKRKTQYFYGRTQAEVRRKRSEAIRSLDDGGTPSPSREKLGEFLTRWLQGTKAKQVRARTLEDYELKVKKHIVPALGHIRLRELTADQVDAFETAMLKTHAPATVRKCHAILSSALKQARRWRLVAYNVVVDGVDAPSVPKYAARTFTAAEGGAFVVAAAEDRLAALWEMAILTGARKGEIGGLRWEDIDTEGRVAHVRHSLNTRHKAWELDPPKTDGSRRDLPLTPDLCAALLRHRDVQAEEREAAGGAWRETGFVFTTSRGTPINQSNLSRSFHRLCDAASVPHIRFHDLRHTVGTLMRALGVDIKDISELLGHASVGITGDLYVHPVPLRLVDAVERLEKLLKVVREEA